jgi:hypothetical protein
MPKAIILAILAACGAPSVTSTEPPSDLAPPDEPPAEDGQHFCCENLGGNGSGDGCVTIDKSHIAACAKILHCGGTYEKDGGNVKCID